MTEQGRTPVSPLDRRVLAIMATDVVGYSRQMEADEAGTIARVTTARAEIIEPLLERHRGRLVKLIGDGTLSLFESVVDAATCAAAIQRAHRERNRGVAQSEQMVLRIGINLGDVALLENDVYGDGVNVAARIESLCDPGGIMFSGTAYDHLQGKLDFPLEFVGEQQVKNIRRPVRTYRAGLEGVVAQHRRRPLPLRSIAAALGALLLAAGGWWGWSTWSAPPAYASIAVLPFDNLGGDEATGRLAEGITEDLITELTRFRALDVISRQATRPYRNQTVDVREVGQRLRVLYILDGTIQRQGERVRVTAQLIETESARDVWSERWDRATTDVFAVQSEVAEAVASRIASPYSGQIISADRDVAKRKKPGNLTAYDLYLLGMESANRASREGLEAAIPLLQKSIAVDPDLARAWTGLAMAYSGLAEMTGYPPELARAREEAARKAVELDPSDAQAHAALATHYMDAGDPARAEAEFDQALQLNPGSADLLAIYAGWASGFGEPEAGVAAAERAMRLNPDTPPWAAYNFAYAYFMAGRYVDALHQFDRMPASSFTPSALIYRAATLGGLGRVEDAAAARRVALEHQPDLSIEAFAAGFSSSDADRTRLIDTMRAAGFPVCAATATLAHSPGLRRLPECVTT